MASRSNTGPMGTRYSLTTWGCLGGMLQWPSKVSTVKEKMASSSIKSHWDPRQTLGPAGPQEESGRIYHC